ncbi:MAG: UDP-N-acetylmuramate dehydrogenase [Candidatus Delongbacteria bacterium]|nr:UDP-N-acetylmuramate dehydrogenase [Candidatus Delongbacteria bacterium]MCG2760880.1 UDP-N-acetylmuramate dehydrogenase [Candidatus Delongbacteria bacterium]
MDTIAKIKNIASDVLISEPMSKHTFYRIGGPAKIFVAPENTGELKEVIEICKQDKIEFFILGKGSNVLVSDSGYDGCIIDFSKYFTKISSYGDLITAQSGSRLSEIASVAEMNSLTGFEEFAGIPGTLGGALIMNAGCYGSEISDKISSVNVLTNGNVVTIDKKDLKFGYRRSSLKGSIILEAVISLEKGDAKLISERIAEFKIKRKNNQPLNMPSCGSVFKRPADNFAGKLIEDCGLKGKSIGGAMVSDLHAGFIVNTGNARSEDVLSLIKHIKKEVFNRYQVQLEEEVIFLGFKNGELE